MRNFKLLKMIIYYEGFVNEINILLKVQYFNKFILKLMRFIQIKIVQKIKMICLYNLTVDILQN